MILVGGREKVTSETSEASSLGMTSGQMRVSAFLVTLRSTTELLTA